MTDTDAASAGELVCHRCGAILTAGRGHLYVVRIDAFADPTPPPLDTAESSASIIAEYETLLAEMSHLSERELMDQVHRRVVLHLCTRCYREWIERPVG